MRKEKIDYEQLYYDELYKNRILEKELDIYKQLLIDKPIKEIIAEDLIKYIKKVD